LRYLLPDKSHSGSDSLSAAQWQQIGERIPQVITIAPYSTAYQPLSFQGKL